MLLALHLAWPRCVVGATRCGAPTQYRRERAYAGNLVAGRDAVLGAVDAGHFEVVLLKVLESCHGFLQVVSGDVGHAHVDRLGRSLGLWRLGAPCGRSGVGGLR